MTSFIISADSRLSLDILISHYPAPNGSATLPFVVPTGAERSLRRVTVTPSPLVIPTGAPEERRDLQSSRSSRS
jgi:hypothetical protein